MRLTRFDDAIGAFLGKKTDETLFISTYGLDETVLFTLLRRFGVPTNKRIIVCHEIMRHRFPGYLAKHYKRSSIVSIVHAGGRRCPVFHPKLWMRVKGGVCNEILLGSFNVSRYHMDDANRTLESICHWENLSVPVPRHPLFDFCRARTLPLKIRRTLAPSTISLICEGNRPVRIDVSKKPVGHSLARKFKLEEDALEFGCAPFLSDRAVASITGTGQASAVRVWDSRMVHEPWDLHGKCLEFSRHVVLGSANLTEQALLGKDGRALNTEAIVCLGKRGTFLKRYFRGIRPRALDIANTIESTLPPGDPDDNDDHDWARQKELAVNAPEDLRLVFEDRDGTAHLSIVAKDKRGRCSGRLLLRSGARPDFGSIRLSTSEIKSIPTRFWRPLARLILNPPVQVEGRRGHKAWQRELDMDEFWLDSEHFQRRMNRIRALVSDNHSSVEEMEDRLGKEFVDVRDIRDGLMRREKLGQLKAVNLRHQWLHKYGSSPTFNSYDWCLRVALQVRGAQGAWG